MSDKNIDYLKNYNSDTLYVNEFKDGKIITVVNDKKSADENYAEIQVSPQVKLALKAVYIDKQDDVNHYELIKFKKDEIVERVTFSSFGLSKILEFNKLIESLNIKDSSSQKISLKNLNTESLASLLSSSDSNEILNAIQENPEIKQDIIALAHKRKELENFEFMLSKEHSESDWQKFFNSNNWIFGHGLNYIFLDSVKDKLEQYTVGFDFNTRGKRTDALMKTKAVLSQYVLVEIKKPETELLANSQYRPSCWQPSTELSGSVAQIQKTLYDFVRNQTNSIDALKDNEGEFTGEEIYRIAPKSYIIIGSLSQISGNEDQIKCFEIYRNSLNYPEIITYDELYERAKSIVSTLEKRKPL